MRRTGLLTFAFAAAMLFSAQSASAKCGAFDLLQGDDYCVKCPGARPEKLYMCPGGPAGLAVAVAQHASCSVTLYDTTCGDRIKRKRPH
jgi:hypothetical protein